jgi:esterase/lipase superfamily enzyme
MMATPVLYKDPRLDLLQHTPPQAHTTEVPVYYATTRAPAQPGNAKHYSNTPGQELRLGVAYIRLGEPGWTFDQLAASDWTSTVAKPRPGVVERIEELGPVPREQTMSEVERQLVARIDARLATVRNPMVVLYVPGYRVTFDDVVVMMGSLSGYLAHGAMVTFPWPTGQSFWSYTDCERAERYIPDIARLIEVLSETKAKYINVIAYSCGSPLLAQALARLRDLHPELDRAHLAQRYRIGNAIFAASDVSLKTFARDLMPPIMDMASQTVVYYSRRDRALWFSDLLAGASRIGRPNVKESLREGIGAGGDLPALRCHRCDRRARSAGDGRHQRARLLVRQRMDRQRRLGVIALSIPATAALPGAGGQGERCGSSPTTIPPALPSGCSTSTLSSDARLLLRL